MGNNMPEVPARDVQSSAQHNKGQPTEPQKRSSPPLPTDIMSHLTALAASLREEEWGHALTHHAQALSAAAGAVSDAPLATFYNPRIAGTASAAQCAERLDRFVSDRQGVSGQKRALAVPWVELWHLLQMALDVILSKRT